MSRKTVLRDQPSLDLARAQLGFSGAATVAADPAFIWAARQMESAAEKPANGNRPVLLALREWQTREYALGLSVQAAAKIKAAFEHELVELVHELRRQAPDWKLQPIAMSTYSRGCDDRFFFRRLFAGDADLLQAIHWKRASPSEDFALFRGARAVVAMRFHSVLLSIAAGVPQVAIDYTRGGKIAALLSAVQAESPMALEGFNGRQCARRLVEVVNGRSAPAPAGVEAAYTSAWRELLATTGS
jgi:polysaccharide pyruvyl transferase WcaK-like protein